VTVKDNGAQPNDAYRIRIEPSQGWVSLKLRELVEYRELLYFLVWRDVKVRYKQTILGVGWAIIQPFFTMVVFSIFSGVWPKCRQTASPIRSSAMRRLCRGPFLPMDSTTPQTVL